MSLHLDARPGDLASSVLLPGDPLRARYVAETFLEGPVLVNERRAAYGYTGTWHGKRVSVQATGMGVPSFSIYAQELIAEYGVRRLIRIGTCGSLQPGVRLGELVLAQGACTNSSLNQGVFRGMAFAPLADWGLLRAAHDAALARGLRVHVGNVYTSDSFYEGGEAQQVWADHGVLAAEMEVAALYTLAARHGVEALGIMTVSDHVYEDEHMPPEQRERALRERIEVALAVA